MRIGAVVAIVAKYEVVVSRDFVLGVDIFGRLGDIGLVQWSAVDVYRAVVDFNDITRCSDDAFDEVGFGVARRVEDNYLAMIGIIKKVTGFTDYNVFAIMNVRHHG